MPSATLRWDAKYDKPSGLAFGCNLSLPDSGFSPRARSLCLARPRGPTFGQFLRLVRCQVRPSSEFSALPELGLDPIVAHVKGRLD
jgi:hypothetical protein